MNNDIMNITIIIVIIVLLLMIIIIIIHIMIVLPMTDKIMGYRVTHNIL